MRLLWVVGDCILAFYLYQLLFNNLESSLWKILVFVAFVINAVLVNIYTYKFEDKKKKEKSQAP